MFHNTHAEYLEALKDGRFKEREKAKGPAGTLWAPEGVEELHLERWYVSYASFILSVGARDWQVEEMRRGEHVKRPTMG
jgi:hypothetical protein